jgi:OOP family OmpA-OmpF porin
MSRGTVWLVGLFGVAAIWGAAVAMKARPIERGIAVAAAAELKRRGIDRRFDPLTLEIDGRHLKLIGTAIGPPDRDAALAVAAATPGVARVTDAIKVAPEVKPYVFRAIRNADGSVTLAGSAPTPDAIDRLIGIARAVFGGTPHLRLGLARGAPEGDWLEAAKLAIEIVALLERGEAVLADRRLAVAGRAPDDPALDAAAAVLERGTPKGFAATADLYTALDEELRGGPITAAAACQALVDRVTAGHPLRFEPGTATLRPAPPRLFDRLARAVGRCGGLYLQIHATGDAAGGDPVAALRSSEARAHAVAEALARRGVDRRRLAALGRGADPRARGASEVEFRIADSAVPVVRPYRWQFEKLRDGDGLITGHHPSREAQTMLAGLARPALRGALTDESRLAHGAPPGEWLAAAQLAIETLARLEHGIAALTDYELAILGVAADDEAVRRAEAALAERMPKGFAARPRIVAAIDEALQGPPLAEAEACQNLFDAVARAHPMEFVFDGAALHERQRQAFERLAVAVRRCPGFTIEIGAHTSGGGDPDAARLLAERWAEAVVDAMARAGAERARLRAVGYGNARPLDDIDSEEGRARNRRVAFRVLP